MKLLYATLLAVAFLSAPALSRDFSGSFGRDTSCQPSNGNWVNDAHITCPMQGSGSGGDHPVAKPTEPLPCPPKDYPKAS